MPGRMDSFRTRGRKRASERAGRDEGRESGRVLLFRTRKRHPAESFPPPPTGFSGPGDEKPMPARWGGCIVFGLSGAEHGVHDAIGERRFGPRELAAAFFAQHFPEFLSGGARIPLFCARVTFNQRDSDYTPR